jgi:hypothetical protein
MAGIRPIKKLPQWLFTDWALGFWKTKDTPAEAGLANKMTFLASLASSDIFLLPAAITNPLRHAPSFFRYFCWRSYFLGFNINKLPSCKLILSFSLPIKGVSWLFCGLDFCYYYLGYHVRNRRAAMDKILLFSQDYEPRPEDSDMNSLTNNR